MFLTLFVGIYHSSTRKFTYANGGHNPPYWISDELRCLDDSKGMAVGIFEEETYEEREVELHDGDTVFLYTDGVNEAVSRDREFFGLTRLEHILEENRQEQCVETVLEAVNCSYAYGQVRGSVDIFMNISDRISIEFCDSGREFNPLEDMVDVEQYDIDKQVGGLGRRIAFDLADEVHYAYLNENNILTLIFKEERI